MDPLVSIIILSWNGKDFIGESIDSALGQTYANKEVIVVENGSTDGSHEFLESTYGNRIRLIASSKNLGYAGGNNLGFSHAKGNYVALLNSDAKADSNWLAELVNGAKTEPNFGMYASKVLNYDNTDIFDSAGLLIYGDGIGRGRGRLERDTGQFDKMEEVLLPSGCACLLDMKLIKDVGGFDEDFFAYCDDTDLGLHARIFGWKCLYIPTAKAFHRYSLSGGKYSKFKVFQVERNRAWVVMKYFPLEEAMMSIGYTIARLFLHAVAAYKGRGAAARFREKQGALELPLTTLRAYLAALLAIPATLNKRKAIEKIRSERTHGAGSLIPDLLERYSITARETAFKD